MGGGGAGANSRPNIEGAAVVVEGAAVVGEGAAFVGEGDASEGADGDGDADDAGAANGAADGAADATTDGGDVGGTLRTSLTGLRTAPAACRMVPKLGSDKPLEAMLEDAAFITSSEAPATVRMIDPGFTSTQVAGLSASEHSIKNRILFVTTVS